MGIKKTGQTTGFFYSIYFLELFPELGIVL